MLAPCRGAVKTFSAEELTEFPSRDPHQDQSKAIVPGRGPVAAVRDARRQGSSLLLEKGHAGKLHAQDSNRNPETVGTVRGRGGVTERQIGLKYMSCRKDIRINTFNK